MKKLVHVLVVTGLMGAPALALAADAPSAFTGNLTLTSDYVFRGVSQTQNGPAIQGGVDYNHSSGLYVGAWASNVAWVKETGFKNNNSMEIDLYGGYKGSVGDLGYDVGAITYYYPGDKIAGAPSPDTTEVYLGASWKFLSLKYSHAVSKHFVGWTTSTGGKTRGSYYVDLTANVPLSDGWAILGHTGYQNVKDNDPATYTDWKLGVSKEFKIGTVALAYSDTNADKNAYTWAGEQVADGRVTVSFSKTF